MLPNNLLPKGWQMGSTTPQERGTRIPKHRHRVVQTAATEAQLRYAADSPKKAYNISSIILKLRNVFDSSFKKLPFKYTTIAV